MNKELITDFTKEEIEVMSDEEVRLWFEKIRYKQASDAMRKSLLDALDIAQANMKDVNCKIIPFPKGN